ncbi:hypothetical protein OOK31_05440 [Streptomyces sp. NBC_00249]|uniref:hypothetical protein n=1 Tax=Streptomyces sp. NBC_00249 TaxID=2975690 RepID=UPI00224F5922|nr:hypothetical protein [Streptomyces sp. NBC_00249]MCX5193335.1 hypothetical protein [Streptomyces sp. NBC_00249]
MSEPSRPDARDQGPGDGHQELRADLQRREDDLNGLLGRFKTLSGGFDELSGKADSLSTAVTSLRSETTDLRKQLSATDAKLDRLVADFTDHRERYERDQAVLAAQFDLDRALGEWRSRFGQRNQVRSLAAGLVRSLTPDLVGKGLLRTGSLRGFIEAHLVHDPEFWLGHATLALAAQLDGDTELKFSAMGEAGYRGDGKTLLFLSLAAARAGAHEWAGNCMDRYLQESVDPDHLDRDFLVVLDAVASGELGEQAHGYASRLVFRWAAEATAGTTAARASARRWEPQLKKLLIPPGDRYASFGEACAGGWEDLQYGWRLATVTTAALDHLRREFPPPGPGARSATRAPYAETAIDRLIRSLEPDEAAAHARMEFLRRFIEHRGDERATREEHDLRQAAQTEVLDFATLLGHAVFEPGRVALGEEARRLALPVVLPHLCVAATAFVNASLQRRKESVRVVIEGWRTVLPTDPAESVDGTALAAELETGLLARTEAEAAAVDRNLPRRVGGTFGGLAGLVLAPFFLVGPSLWLALVVGGATSAWGLLDVRRVPAERARVRAAGAARNDRAQRRLREVLGSRVAFFTDWNAHAARLEELRDWNPTGQVTQ